MERAICRMASPAHWRSLTHAMAAQPRESAGSGTRAKSDSTPSGKESSSGDQEAEEEPAGMERVRFAIDRC